jgi:hypothetical protein
MPGGSSGGGMPGGSSGGGMPGGSSGGDMPDGSAGGAGGIRGVSGPVPGLGGSGGSGANVTNCEGGATGGTGGWGGPDQNCDGSVGQYPGESEANRKARLEKKLDESVGGFDEVLAEEQREISTVGRNTEGFGGQEGGAGSGRVGLGSQGSGGSGGGASGEPGNAATPPEKKQASIGGMSDEEIKSRTPEDIPDLVSEDIVAKQLREAAIAESDPDLRERLWEEYRSYNDLY